MATIRARPLVVALGLAALAAVAGGALVPPGHARRAVGLVGLAIVLGESAVFLAIDARTDNSALRAVLSHKLELLLTTLLLTLSTAYLIEFVRTMAHAPLWTDELASVLFFSSRGPRVVVTNYNAPNNQIFLNLVNSLLPAAHSLNPLRERLVSILSIVAMQVITVYEFFRRRWYLAGAVLCFAFAVNFNWLDETLQDRGYGLLGFGAVAISLWLWRYLEDHGRRWLVGMAIVTVLGTWTEPSFLFFCGPLWLLLLGAERSRRILLVGAASLVAIVLLYLPVARQLVHQFTTYATTSGREYDSLSAAPLTFTTYLLGHYELTWPFAIALMAPLLVMLPAPDRAPRWLAPPLRVLGLGVDAPVRTLTRILMGSAGTVLVIALALKTPPQRTVAYVVVPVALVTVVSVAELLQDRRVGSPVRGASAIAVVLLLVVHGSPTLTQFSYVPIENWSSAATFVTETFPEHLPVVAPVRGLYLAAYLDPNRHAVVTAMTGSELQSGTAAIELFDPGGEIRGLREHLLAFYPNLLEMDLGPVRRGADRTTVPGVNSPHHVFPVLIAPPLHSNIEQVTVRGESQPSLVDGSLATGYSTPPQVEPSAPVTMRVTLTGGIVARSLVIAMKPGSAPLRLSVRASTPDGRQFTVPAGATTSSIWMQAAVVVDLGDRPVSSIEITASGSSHEPFSPRELWVYAP